MRVHSFKNILLWWKWGVAAKERIRAKTYGEHTFCHWLRESVP